MTITRKLAEILGDVDRPGDFSASGRAEFLAPRLEVEGVGPIALPLLPAQAKQLIKAATRAPYGRGADTVIDTKVRRTWVILYSFPESPQRYSEPLAIRITLLI